MTSGTAVAPLGRLVPRQRLEADLVQVEHARRYDEIREPAVRSRYRALCIKGETEPKMLPCLQTLRHIAGRRESLRVSWTCCTCKTPLPGIMDKARRASTQKCRSEPSSATRETHDTGERGPYR